MASDFSNEHCHLDGDLLVFFNHKIEYFSTHMHLLLRRQRSGGMNELGKTGDMLVLNMGRIIFVSAAIDPVHRRGL